MKFAFSTVSCPKWDFPTIAARAKEYGYDGVEIRGFLNEALLTAANIFLTDPNKVRQAFTDAGVEVACLASSIAVTTDKKRNALLADNLRHYIDTAAFLGCRVVKIFDMQLRRPGLLPRAGDNHATAALIMRDWLAPLGDIAAEHDMLLVIENALSFRTAKQLWYLLDTLNHPNVAACWDIFNGAQIGESPYISVPVLNNRIQYTQVKDAKLGALGAAYCKLGEGDVPVRKFITRLMGIGYEGYVTVEWEKAWLPNIAEPEEILPDAITKLREWIKPAGEEEEPKKKEHAAAGA